MALRPSLPTSSSDFALHPSTSSSSPSSADDFNPLLMRFRRPSLLAPPRATFYSEGRLNSPLAGSSFISPSSRRYTASSTSGEESESDKEKMWTDSPPSGDSRSNTPLTPVLAGPSPSLIDKERSTASVHSGSSTKSTEPHSTSGTIGSVKLARSTSPPAHASSPVERVFQPETPPPKQRRRLSHPINVSGPFNRLCLLNRPHHRSKFHAYSVCLRSPAPKRTKSSQKRSSSGSSLRSQNILPNRAHLVPPQIGDVIPKKQV